MIKERISLSGDLKDKVKQLMQYAGWFEGRKVDISIAEQYYFKRGVEMMKSTRRFYQKYFGLCCEWYLEQKKMNIWKMPIFVICPAVNWLKLKRLLVNGASLSVILAIIIRQRFGFLSTENCTQSMSIRMKSNAFLM